MPQKMCCGRQSAKLRLVETELNNVVRKASKANEKGRLTQRHHDDIARAKDLVVKAKANIEEHAANHAGQEDPDAAL